MNGFKHHVFLDSRLRGKDNNRCFFYLLILYSFFVIPAQAGIHIIYTNLLKGPSTPYFLLLLILISSHDSIS